MAACHYTFGLQRERSHALEGFQTRLVAKAALAQLLHLVQRTSSAARGLPLPI
jgi:hypothetical protein